MPLHGRNRLHPPRHPCRPRDQLGIGAPPLCREQRPFLGPERVAEGDQPQRHEAGQDVRDAGHPHPAAQQQGAQPAHQPSRERRLSGQLALRHDDVGAALESPHEVRDEARSVRKVGVHEDRAVALRSVGALDRDAEQLLDGRSIPTAGLVPNQRQWQDTGIRLQDLRGRVGRAVVRHEKVVLPGEAAEDLPDFPEQKPHGRGFVVTRNADVDHDRNASETGGKDIIRGTPWTPPRAASATHRPEELGVVGTAYASRSLEGPSGKKGGVNSQVPAIMP